ncbi:MULTISPECIES: GTP cyclohydrolase II [unclassified Archaeoglobus]|jgi:3,4-dihydroxy 2-butanone 4-phosphate synthase/GTP cyclohydrolase II|uniref:GTP cyclohydrolase II n=1 Tax=unclassified Archaeoglobus TaxID=2643606 RepID=UPI0025B8235F|nr:MULTISPECIES: GTP cyclohydrolase II [unclassified Archaeoglobus]
MDELALQVKSGKPAMVLDSEKCVICIPAELITGEILNFMMKNCDEIRLALPWSRILSLGLNRFRFQNGNMIPIDPNMEKVSAEDRARFIRDLVSGKVEDIKYPGRIFVEETKEMGVLERPGMAEACVDLARMAGFSSSAVYAPLMTAEGNVAGEEYALSFAEEHNLPIFRIKDMIEYRIKSEKIVERVVEATLPTKFYGVFKAVGYRTPLGEIVALVRGNVSEGDVLVRIHSECLTGDIFHSLRCDCGDQLESALKMIDRENKGVAIYMRGHEGRGIGLINKLMAYKLQEDGIDTVDANIELGFPPDMRSYGIAAQILMDLGVKSIRLLTNNPLKIEELKKYGFRIKREPIEVEPCSVNLPYLKAKKDKMGHMLCFND